MEDRHKAQVSSEAIAERLIDALEIELQAHRRFPVLIATIENEFETYFDLEEGRIGKTSLQVFDYAITALERVAPIYIELYDFDPKKYLELCERVIKDKEILVLAEDSKEIEKRLKKINALYRDLWKLREKFRRTLIDLHPMRWTRFLWTVNCVNG